MKLPHKPLYTFNSRYSFPSIIFIDHFVKRDSGMQQSLYFGIRCMWRDVGTMMMEWCCHSMTYNVFVTMPSHQDYHIVGILQCQVIALWNYHRNMLLHCPDIILSCYHCVMLFCYNCIIYCVIMVSFYHCIMLLCCNCIM